MQHNAYVGSGVLGIICRAGNLALLQLFRSVSILDKRIEVIVYLHSFLLLTFFQCSVFPFMVTHCPLEKIISLIGANLCSPQ